MIMYEVEIRQQLSKIAKWIGEQSPTNFSVLCWSVWHKTEPTYVLSLLQKRNAHLVCVEDDNGEIRVILYFELRTPQEDKLDNVAVATFASSIIDKNDYDNNDGTHYKALLDWMFKRYLSYGVPVYSGDFFAVEQCTNWLKELCGKYLTVIGEKDTRLGKVFRFTIDIKGYVEKT